MSDDQEQRKAHMMECKQGQIEGLIFNIQRFSVHDGPGIRTPIFMQGCPLRCLWCDNPESWTAKPVIMTRDAKCISCAKCLEVCPVSAITVDEEEGRRIDFTLCTQCGECVLVCPTLALVTSGKYMTIDEVVSVVERDRLFYRNSGGGVTISGGEPSMQADFVERLIKTMKEMGLHVALDTSGRASWNELEKLVSVADLILYDIKHMDTEQHRRGTGKGNKQILENAAKAGHIAKVWLRVPVLPGYNDSEENIKKTAELGKQIGAEKISLLPFHRWGEPKYGQLGIPYTWQGEEPDPQHIRKLEGIIHDTGLQASVGR